MSRRRPHEEHVNHEAWAIPYGDLVTLLLAFFVVMYAISSVNEGKYRVVSESLNAAFHGTPHQRQPVETGDTPAQQTSQLPMNAIHRIFGAGMPSTQLLAVPRSDGVAANAATTASTTLAADAAAHATSAVKVTTPLLADPDARADADGLSQVAGDVTAAMQGLIAKGQVTVHRYGTWVAVDISADVLFPSGVAQLSPAAVKPLQKLADALKAWPNAVRVEGHTDNVPISTRAFPSNWELSAARAASVVRLFMDRGLPPARLAVIGFGQYRPLRPNSTSAGRNANRRVVVAILGPQGGSDRPQ